MPKTMIHINPVKPDSEAHNRRLKPLDHVRDDLTKFNESWHSDGRSLVEIYAEIQEDFRANHPKKMPSNSTPIREGVVLVKDDTTIPQLRKACDKCEERFGVKALFIDIHKDEGHYEKDNTWAPNLHAHITFLWYDFEAHKTCKLDEENSAEMQDIFADELGMERGLPSTKKGLNWLMFKIKKKQEELQALQAELKATRRVVQEEKKKLSANRASDAEKELAMLKKYNPAMKCWKAGVQEMIEAGLPFPDIQNLLAHGRAEVMAYGRRGVKADYRNAEGKAQLRFQHDGKWLTSREFKAATKKKALGI